MTIAEELAKLEEMRGRGNLTDEEFAQAKAKIIGETGTGNASTPVGGIAAVNSLRRSNSDRWLAGVCGGLAKSTGLESWLLRLLFCILLVFGGQWPVDLSLGLDICACRVSQVAPEKRPARAFF